MRHVMTTNLLSKFNSVRTALEQERDKCLARAAEIDAALTSNNGHIRSSAQRGPATNKQSLKSIVAEIVRRKPLSKQEIMEQVLARGYKFSTDKPMGSINAMLYSTTGRKEFRNQDGKFSVK